MGGLIPNSNELLSKEIFYSIHKEERIKFGENNLIFYIIEESKTNNYWCSLELNKTTLYHFILGLAFILSEVLVYSLSILEKKLKTHIIVKILRLTHIYDFWQMQFSLNLKISSTILYYFPTKST